ncbi:MAG: hypothetical protein A2X94_17470 [Bdellovibrionales bacterium GWB1_55_8]|nr:MAG: hypothetical protein A2X94_17470 [Bdellovibrionales bacterium GWB1_55_8]
MLHKRWVPRPISGTLIFAISSILASASGHAGPRSSVEAEVLWKQGKEAYHQEKYAEAARELQRFVDRYPGATGYLEAHLLLGRSLLKTGNPARAIPPLRYVTSASRSENELAAARVLLARAYMESGKHEESYQTTIEIEKKHGGSQATQSEALLIRARALTGQGHEARAAKVLESAKALIVEERAEAAWLELDLKHRKCARFPSQSPLDEEKVRDQLARRGDCLGEALLLFRAVLETSDPAWSRRALEDTKGAFKNYWKICSHPPDPPEPPEGSRKPRTPLQLKRYRGELTAFLQAACRSTLRNQIGILKAWESQLPQATSSFSMGLADQLAGISGETGSQK